MPKITIEELPEMKKGGIHIKKKNRGKFTAYKKRTGKTTEEALHSKDPHVRKMAQFAKNAKKFKHRDGGLVNTGMGVQHPYWFNKNGADNKKDINPDTDVDITSTVKPVDEEDATIEAERGEIIVKPDLAGIYKILGKKHYNGGTPLAPQPGSFIFSVNKDLAISKDDKETFEFKKGGSPADVLDKEIDIKEYNRYVSVIQDPRADKIAKATAKLMIEKYQRKIGQVAFLQESKKNKPTPEFSMGTAPVKDPELEQQEDEQEMYRYGGTTPQMQWGGLTAPRVAQQIMDLFPCKPGDIPCQEAKKAAVHKRIVHKTTNRRIPPVVPTEPVLPPMGSFTPGNQEIAPPEEEKIVAPVVSAEKKQEDINTIPTLPYYIKGELTPAQKANIGFLGLQAMGIKKYGPTREQVDLPQVRLDRPDVQPYLNAIQNQQFQAYNSTNAADPRTAKLMGSNIYGRGLDASNQAISQVAGQTLQVGNAENQFNTQQKTQQAIRNSGLSHQYYDQTIQANQNYDNEKRFAKNQVISTLNQYQSEQDTLDWQLASISKWGQRKVTDPKTGKTYNMPTPLYEPTKRGIKYNADVASLNMVSGAGKVDSYEEISNIMQKFGINPSDSKQVYAFARLFSALSSGKQPVYTQNPGYPGQ